MISLPIWRAPSLSNSLQTIYFVGMQIYVVEFEMSKTEAETGAEVDFVHWLLIYKHRVQVFQIFKKAGITLACVQTITNENV